MTYPITKNRMVDGGDAWEVEGELEIKEGGSLDVDDGGSMSLFGVEITGFEPDAGSATGGSCKGHVKVMLDGVESYLRLYTADT